MVSQAAVAACLHSSAPPAPASPPIGQRRFLMRTRLTSQKLKLDSSVFPKVLES